MLRRLSKLVPSSRLNMFIQGLFSSKVLYCLQVFGNVWGFGYDESSRRYSAFSVEDLRKLQVLQNKVCRLKTGLGYDHSTESLLRTSRELSMHQLIAYHTLVTVHKIKVNEQPEYLDKRMEFCTEKENFGRASRQVDSIYTRMTTLTISRSGFVYRGSLLWNQLPNWLRTLKQTKKFKTEVKKWEVNNVGIKPG